MNDGSPVDAEVIAQVVDLARQAGEAIMAIYTRHQDYEIKHKTDESPLTAADLAAHNLLYAALPALLALPIISEEGELPDYNTRQLWESYWLIDPLDGTREFIAGNGEFTVNIALIYQGRPLLGVVHVPVTDITYLGVLEAREQRYMGAWKYTAGKNPQLIRVRSLDVRKAQGLPFTAVLSHRHGTHATGLLMEVITRHWPGPIETSSAGSSLKFCLIAEGVADFYPRLAPTSEWDTAAAQAVLEAAGGAVVRALEPADNALIPLTYNASDDILNPHFYALGDRTFDWFALLAMWESARI